MLGFKNQKPGKDQANANSKTIKSGVTMAQPQPQSQAQPPRPVAEPPAARPESARPQTTSSIGTGMSITGTVECNGPAEIFGRIDGQIRASELLIGEGARIEG